MALQITYVKCPENKYSIKCPYTMKPTRIVVHNTASTASAMNEISYMLKNDKTTSFHFAVDDTRAVQGLPLNRNGWHAGDGRNGIGNRYGIGIEICYSKTGGEKFTKSEENGAKLVAMLLKQYSWGIDKVTKHQDYSGKYCPHRTLDLGWQRFLDMVQDELDELNGVNKIEAYSGYVQVTYGGSDGIDIHTKPTFTGNVVKVAKKGEVFQVVGRIKVSGTYMYKLKDGNYITSAEKYVKYTKTNPTPAPKPTNDNVKTYKVVTTINGYTNASNAKNRKNSTTKVASGTYYIYNESQGMKNITKKKGTPGSWINPSDNVKETTPSVVGKTLYLPATESHWNVYPLSKSPTVGNECGALNPKKFGGLTYKILAQPQANVVTISTYNYGKVNIYVGKDTPAIIK